MKLILINLIILIVFISCETQKDDVLLMERAKKFLENSSFLKEKIPDKTNDEYGNLGIYSKQYGPLLFGFEDKIIECRICIEVLEENRKVKFTNRYSFISEFDKIGVEYSSKYGYYNIPDNLVDSTKNILVTFRRPISGVLGGMVFLKDQFKNEEHPYAEFTLFYNDDLEIIKLIY